MFKFWKLVEKTVEKKVWFSNQVLSVSKTRNFTLSEYVYIILSYSILIERFRFKQKKKVVSQLKKHAKLNCYSLFLTIINQIFPHLT